MLCLHSFTGPGTRYMLNKYSLNECSIVILRSLGVVLRTMRNHQCRKRGQDFMSFCFRNLTFDDSMDMGLDGPRLEVEKPVRGLFLLMQ